MQGAFPGRAQRYALPLALALPLLALFGWWASTRGSGYRLIPAPREVALAL